MAGKPRFVYVIYIRSTREKLWHALTDADTSMQYWYGARSESEWTAGASWRLMIPDGRVADSGKVLEAEPPKRLVLLWRNEFVPELKAEGYSRATFELEQEADLVKLTVIHEMDRDESKFIEAVSNGWPSILSSLKSLLETGESLEVTRHWPEGV